MPDQQAIDSEDVECNGQVKQQGVNYICHSSKEVSHEPLKDLISEKGKKDTGYANANENDFADEDSSTFSRLMHRINVISGMIIIFEAIPAKLMSTGT